MNPPTCRDCSGHGTRYYPGDPRRQTCWTCGGTGERKPKAIETRTAINPLGDRKRVKMAAVVEHKMNFLAMVAEASGGAEYLGDFPAAPCQTCTDLVAVNMADFSHKKAAGMGGAGDEGGLVLASNGTWSCRCDHAFIEQDQEAREQHRLSPANMENGLKVEFTKEVEERRLDWRRRWHNIPKEVK